jgi:hypothetical protein
VKTATTVPVPSGPVQAVIGVDPRLTYQKMLGWEATAQAGEVDSPLFGQYKDLLYDRAVNDLGINRLRLEVHESASGFDLARLDQKMQRVVLPIKQRLEARGERLFLNMCVVGNRFATNPSGYANATLGVYRHMQSAYGFLPDRWEVALEPDTFAWGPISNVSNAIVAAGNTLKANGFPVAFSAPSSLDMHRSATWMDDIAKNPTALGYVSEFVYHSYSSASDTTRQAIAAKGARYGKTTAMLEHIAAPYDELHADLKLANVSAWQQYTLAYPAAHDDGAQYYWIDKSKSTPEQAVVLSNQARYLRQYFKYIRLGSVRIGANTTNASFDPLAFVNANGAYVVVINAKSPGAFSVQGLPPGTYEASYSLYGQNVVKASDLSVLGGQSLTTSIPGTGLITIAEKGLVP